MASLPRGSTVTTSLGKGYVEAIASSLTEYLIMFARPDFDPEVWVTKFSPGNGPNVFTLVDARDCQPLDEPSKVAPIYSQVMATATSTTSTPRAPKDPNAPVKILPVSTEIAIGQVWKSNRSPAEYAVHQILPDGQIKLKEVGTSYTRVVPPQTLVKMYTFIRVE